MVNNNISGWWFQTFFIFHNVWDVILPIDFHIFQDGYCTTNKIIDHMFLKKPMPQKKHPL